MPIRHRLASHRRLPAAAATLCLVLLAGSLAREAHATVRKPSTDMDPFEKIDLYADRIGGVGLSDHVNISEYPDSINGDNKLFRRDGADTVGIFKSFAHDAVNIRINNTTPQSYIELKVDPPRYATSIAFLTMAFNVFDGTGGFADLGKVACDLTATWANSATLTDQFAIGSEMRAFRTGSNCSFPYFTLHPTDPLCGAVWTGSSGTELYYYDVQEIRPPANLQGTKLSTIKINAHSLFHNCSGVSIYGGNRLHGISVGTNFRVRTRTGGAVVRQRQGDAAWGADPYGGYNFNGTVVGPWKTLSAKGCFLTSCSMVHNFYGVASTPRTLNQWLEQSDAAHRGFAVSTLGTVRQVQGQAVGDTLMIKGAANSDLAVNDELLIEHQAYVNPVVTVRIVNTAHGPDSLKAVIKTRHGNDPVNVNDFVVVYMYPIHTKIADGFSNNVWSLEPASGADAVDLVEKAMADSVPVLIHGRVSNTGVARHWFVGTGMRPRYDQKRGTYPIVDPAYNVPDLLDAPHYNKYTEGRIGRKTAAPRQVEGLLALSLAGNAVLHVTDPQGRSVVYDPASQNYSSEIPESIANYRWEIEDPADTSAVDPKFDILEVPGAIDGTYLVEVVGTGSGEFDLSASDFDTQGGHSGAAVAGQTTPGSSTTYEAVYSSQPGVPLQFHPLPGSAPGRREPSGSSWIRIHPNPVVRAATVRLDLASSGPVRAEIYDVTGHRVAVLADRVMAAGTVSLTWNGKDEDGREVSRGVFFARVMAGDRLGVVKFLVTR